MSGLRAAVWRRRVTAVGADGPLAESRRWLGATPAEVAAEHARRLRETLQHAHDHVPYYREALEAAGVVSPAGDSAGEVDLGRFGAVPLLDKATLRERFADLRSDTADAAGAYLSATGGSTGEPVRFLHDRGSSAWMVANKELFDSWTGYRVGEPRALLWGAVGDLRTASTRARLGVWLRHELRLEAYELAPAALDDYLARLARFRPTLLLAYAQSAYELALHARRRGVAAPHVPAVMTSATTLEPHMRETIADVFGARVYDRYGSREVLDVACENGDGLGLVVNPLTHHVEVVDERGRPLPPGQAGELVVTPLINRSMPLVRYRIGDAGVLGEAGVGGVPWPRIVEVKGRVTDVFPTAAGGQVYGGFFTRQFYGRDWVARFQVVQEELDRLHVKVVPRPGVDPSSLAGELESLGTSFRGAMGADCLVEFEVVDDIPVGPTGKLRYTVSQVRPRP